jgi:hypothetical protein
MPADMRVGKIPVEVAVGYLTLFSQYFLGNSD